MKITKEKIMYFLSLNICFYFLFFIFEYKGESHDVYQLVGIITVIIITIFIPSIFVYMYAKNSKKHSVFVGALLFASIWIVFGCFPFIKDLFSNGINIRLFFLTFFNPIFRFYSFGLLSLFLTEPLRRKIVW